jgi:hypothetical protein
VIIEGELLMANEATTSEAVTDNNGSVATTTYVVGEHSVYKSVEDLFEGAKQKEQYIQKLLNDLKEANSKVEELSQKSNVVEQLKQIRENKMDTENTNTPLPEDAIKQIALNAMQEANKATEAESNLANCKQAVASLNADVELALKNKAQELGCSVEYLEGIAKTSPKAFKSMFGIKEAVSYDSVNFLQSSRHASTETASTEAEAFFKNKEAHSSPTKVAEFMKKALANPEMLANIKW